MYTEEWREKFLSLMKEFPIDSELSYWQKLVQIRLWYLKLCSLAQELEE